MNSGDSVQDPSRTVLDETALDEPALDEASGLAAAAGQGGPTPARSPGTHKPLQDIQDIIDKLAAVTQQLRHPRGSVASRSN